MNMSCLDAYISRYGDFCANDDNDNDDTTDYFTPCACAHGVTSHVATVSDPINMPLKIITDLGWHIN